MRAKAWVGEGQPRPGPRVSPQGSDGLRLWAAGSAPGWEGGVPKVRAGGCPGGDIQAAVTEGAHGG